MKFQVFISYCRSCTKSGSVPALHQLLSNTFDKIKFWRDTSDIEPSDDWELKIKEAIQSSQLVLVFLTKDACLSPHVKAECRLAEEAKVKILPILMDADLTPRSIETAFPSLHKLQRIDAAGLGGIGAVEQIISAVKKDYELHLTAEVRIFEEVGELVRDITQRATKQVRIFMIDGGTTVRNLLRGEPIGQLLEKTQGPISFQCMFVETDISQTVAGSVAGRGKLGPEVTPAVYRTIFEGLLQGSMWVHTNGPHDVDVSDNVRAIAEICDEYSGRVAAEVRLIPILPVNRLLLTDDYCYIPNFFPLLDGLRVRKSSYYALRFSNQTHIYKVASNYFDHYWQVAQPVKP